MESPELEFLQDDIAVAKPLPTSTVFRFIAENIPREFTFEKEMGKLMIQCGTEFVLMISSAGYEFAEKESMTTITPRHIVAALNDLGYREYVEEIERLMDLLKFDTRQKRLDRKRRRGNLTGLTEEELLKHQTELFGAARESFGSTSGQNK